MGKKDGRKDSSPLLSRTTPLQHKLDVDLHGRGSEGSLLSLGSFGRSHSVQSFVSIKRTQQRTTSRSLSPTCCEELRTMKSASVSSHRSPPVASTHSSIGEGFRTKDTSYHLPNGISNHFGQTASPSPVQRSALKKQSVLGQKQKKKSIDSPRLKPANSLKLAARAGLTASVDGISGTASTPDFSNFMQAATPKDASSYAVSQRRGSLDLTSSPLPLRLRPLNSSSLSSTTTSTTGSGETGTVTEKAVRVMDLYILKQSTDFYHQLYTAWRDSNIVSTCMACACSLFLQASIAVHCNTDC